MSNKPSTDSIRRIRLEQIAIGMYITQLSDHRAIESGLKARGLITREETVARFRKLEVAHVFIDISKGIDCPGSESVEAMERCQEEKFQQLSKESISAPTVAFDQEIRNAVDVRDRAHELIQDVMQDVKMGRGLDATAINAITTEVIQSLTANQNALNSLMCVRNMDQYLLEHSTNVAVLMGVLARSMGIGGNELHQLVFGAFVHDVGKILVPDEILNKPGRLAAHEWEEMKRHVEYGIQSLRDIPGLSKVALEICGQHHERLDGTGYPLALPAEKITSAGRMAAVVDVYDAITADRVYHKGTEPTAALKKMLGWTDVHLDRTLVYQLIRCISLYPAGAWVLLTRGMVALVREVNYKKPTRPSVLLVYDTNARCRAKEKVVNLAETDNYGEIKAAVSPANYKLDIADYLH